MLQKYETFQYDFLLIKNIDNIATTMAKKFVIIYRFFAYNNWNITLTISSLIAECNFKVHYNSQIYKYSIAKNRMAYYFCSMYGIIFF